MKKILIILVALVLLGGGYYVMSNQKPEEPAGSAMPVVDSPTVVEQMMEKTAVKEFTLDTFEFGFDQKTLTVKEGDTVTITITNSGKMMHDFVVDEFDAKTKQIKNGETDTITFVAGTAGEYEYYCSVGQHRKNGMVGKLIVE